MSRMRDFGKLANKINDIQKTITLDSAEVLKVCNANSKTVSEVLPAIDSNFIVLKQNKTFGSLVVGSNTLSSLGITDTESSGGIQFILDSSKNTIISGAPVVLNTLNKLSDAINNDSTAYNSLTTFVQGLLDSANNGGWGGS